MITISTHKSKVCILTDHNIHTRETKKFADTKIMFENNCLCYPHGISKCKEMTLINGKCTR